MKIIEYRPNNRVLLLSVLLLICLQLGVQAAPPSEQRPRWVMGNGWLEYAKYSFDSQYLLTIHQDIGARLWNRDTGASRWLSMPFDITTPVFFLSDGKTLVTRDGIHWDIETDALIRDVRFSAPIAESKSDLAAADVSQTGQWLAVSNFNSGYTTIFNMASGALVKLLLADQGEHPRILDLKFSPNEKFIAVRTGGDMGLSIWSTETWLKLHQLPSALWRRENGQTGIAFSPDSSLIAYLEGETVLLAETLTGEILRVLAPRKTSSDHYVTSPFQICFTPDLQSVVLNWWGGYWTVEVETGKQTHLQPVSNSFLRQVIAVSPDAETFALQGNPDAIDTIASYSPAYDHYVMTHRSLPEVRAIRIVPDSNDLLLVAGFSLSRHSLTNGDLQTSPVSIEEFVVPSNSPLLFEFSSDGETLWAFSEDFLRGDQISVIDTNFGTLMNEFSTQEPFNDESPNSLIASADQSMIAVAYGNFVGKPMIEMYNSHTGENLWIVRKSDWPELRSAAFSPDSTMLAITSGQGKIQLLRATDGNAVASLDNTNFSADTIKFSLDGHRLFGASRESSAAYSLLSPVWTRYSTFSAHTPFFPLKASQPLLLARDATEQMVLQNWATRRIHTIYIGPKAPYWNWKTADVNLEAGLLAVSNGYNQIAVWDLHLDQLPPDVGHGLMGY